MHLTLGYVAAMAAFFALDVLWLGVVAKAFYANALGAWLRPAPHLAAAAAFYLLYVGGIVYFAVAPALRGGGWSTALLSGALLGLLAYGTYDMTNLATLKNWPLRVSVVDMAWGTALTALAALAGYGAARAFAP
ncbi:MAG: DUF2177 family protein [Alphaproteobacteria bacterium]|nr:MAG: DUF2177 family protein [Alphaproteobacteria bacterium]